jgi:catechol 2,3-dioxygenase-like lactoylglutathione lyase family enzyme
MTQPTLAALDHLVLTVADIAATCAFYRDVLGMTPEAFQPADGSTRWALKFGAQKINLHQSGAEFEPKAAQVQPGSADLCFLSETPLEDWQQHFAALGVRVELGPLPRSGATGPIRSLYLRDPDGNLIEVSNKTKGG